MRARCVISMSLALLSSGPSLARADEASVTAAESLFEGGRDLLEKGRIEFV
jgi:hypothetical protein